MPRSLVFIVGAGSTVADASSAPVKRRPPLDRGFFASVRSAKDDPSSQWAIGSVKRYMQTHYGKDIESPVNDSLEAVFACIYTDIGHPELSAEAANAFRSLVYSFNRRLAWTTNVLAPTMGRSLYRILCKWFREGLEGGDIGIITFNYDLQIERTLDALQSKACWKRLGRLFAFPQSYHLDLAPGRVTRPPAGQDVFQADGLGEAHVPIVKLHGSLNWYSVHHSRTPSVPAMLRRNREVWVTPRKTIQPQMTLQRGRVEYTLPVVVPPVIHKTGILHEKLVPLWREAERLLGEAEEVVVFGYSCPPVDHEASNLMERSLKPRRPSLTVIDPNPEVLGRFLGLADPKKCEYYSHVRDYLTS